MLWNPLKRERLGNSYPFCPQNMGTFLSSDSCLMIYFTTWETHNFPHQFLIVRENSPKSTLWLPRLFFNSINVSTCSKSDDPLKEQTDYISYPNILMKSAATVVFGRKVSQGSSCKKDLFYCHVMLWLCCIVSFSLFRWHFILNLLILWY